MHHFSELVSYYRYPQTLRYSVYKKLTSKIKQAYYYSFVKKCPLIEIYAYAFMPNHYHLLLKQLQEDGIKRFISILQNSYAKYYNKKNSRDGGVFQNPFQGKWIATDEQLLHVSRYIHLNPVTSFIIPIDKLSSYKFTSFQNYVHEENSFWVNTKPILAMFKDPRDYKQFVENQSEYQRSLSEIQHLIID